MNILFTCGGTAGHVNPAVALARIFQQRHPDCKALFVGADGGMENRLVPKEGYEIRTVTITNFRRSLKPENIVHNVGTLINMQKSRAQARKILDEFKPDLVVGTGGYASYPVVKQAAKRGIPTAVHESNAVPGLTTKALSKVVDRVMVGFETSRSHYPDPDKVVVTGTPVRGDFFDLTREEARQMFRCFNSLTQVELDDKLYYVLALDKGSASLPRQEWALRQDQWLYALKDGHARLFVHPKTGSDRR